MRVFRDTDALLRWTYAIAEQPICKVSDAQRAMAGASSQSSLARSQPNEAPNRGLLTAGYSTVVIVSDAVGLTSSDLRPQKWRHDVQVEVQK
mgnify:CR=1 FL=1